MDEENDKGLVLLSGGLDSSVLLAYLIMTNLHIKFETVTFHYGQKHWKEIASAQSIAKFYGVKNYGIDISQLQPIFNSALTKSSEEIPSGDYTLENAKKTVVPNRNMVLISIASAFGLSNDFDFLAIGTHSNDYEVYPDCRSEFLTPLRDALRNADWKSFDLVYPFVLKSKAEIVSIGNQLNVPFELTWSCYLGGEIHCKSCPTCKERIQAFKMANIPDPIKYKD